MSSATGMQDAFEQALRVAGPRGMRQSTLILFASVVAPGPVAGRYVRAVRVFRQMVDDGEVVQVSSEGGKVRHALATELPRPEPRRCRHCGGVEAAHNDEGRDGVWCACGMPDAFYCGCPGFEEDKT